MTDPAGVQGAQQTAATAEERLLAAEDAGGERVEHELQAAFAEARFSSGAPSANPAPLLAPPPSAGPLARERWPRELQQSRPVVVPICFY